MAWYGEDVDGDGWIVDDLFYGAVESISDAVVTPGEALEALQQSTSEAIEAAQQVARDSADSIARGTRAGVADALLTAIGGVAGAVVAGGAVVAVGYATRKTWLPAVKSAAKLVF